MFKNKLAQVVVGAVVFVSELALSSLVIAQTSDHDKPSSFALDNITVAATLPEQLLYSTRAQYLAEREIHLLTYKTLTTRKQW